MGRPGAAHSVAWKHQKREIQLGSRVGWCVNEKRQRWIEIGQLGSQQTELGLIQSGKFACPRPNETSDMVYCCGPHINVLRNNRPQFRPQGHCNACGLCDRVRLVYVVDMGPTRAVTAAYRETKLKNQLCKPLIGGIISATGGWCTASSYKRRGISFSTSVKMAGWLADIETIVCVCIISNEKALAVSTQTQPASGAEATSEVRSR
ncbi:hypothetical protein CLF_110371 [Clonorchis sinensis]|uniref:Uncharacterized protein n=1 Tax=Clonorchis sinensis TaxID=79923 RepID=G7YKL1_CLOSI|nr:hypothetical protein CLF_110371 [Clonorchis sinensis]